jgi:hypothetical protein
VETPARRELRESAAKRSPTSLVLVALASGCFGAVLCFLLLPSTSTTLPQAQPDAPGSADGALQGAGHAEHAEHAAPPATGVGSSYGVPKFPWPTSTPLPDKISVVIMNWQRPHFVKQTIEQLSTYKAVGEILVWHCHPNTTFTSDIPIVRTIDDPAADRIWGLATR